MVNTGIFFLIFVYCPSQIINYILTGLVSKFFMHHVTGWHLLCRKEITISVTIHEISRSWKKTIDGGFYTMGNIMWAHFIWVELNLKSCMEEKCVRKYFGGYRIYLKVLQGKRTSYFVYKNTILSWRTFNLLTLCPDWSHRGLVRSRRKSLGSYPRSVIKNEI